jgi:hypothetical protein
MNPRPDLLKDEACLEGYQYFDANIRQLPKKPDGRFDEANLVFVNSDIDAFRHAYVSAVFTHEYGPSVAELFGRLNELTSIFSPGASAGEENMDLWNNAVGRRYAAKYKDKAKLLEGLRDALRKGEFIITPKDDRIYEGASHFEIDANKPIIVLDESRTGRNEVFYDVAQKKSLSRSELVSAISSGRYSGYSLRNINGLETPVSKTDGQELNNLG